MKILAIRGTNLASLETIDVSFADGPLAAAGLFAITGPTGAGKSTLLDAMCLALFGRTPRLSDNGGVEIGLADEEHRLKAFDARNLVRRGATGATAEVEFLGQDDRRYLAKWSVRRARNKADGKLQTQDRSLVDLTTGQTIGEGPRQVGQAVAERLGLTFEQFTRSALLAQGDFAAFLKAKPDERAELLEKVTGTSIYGEVSKAAHQKAAELQRQIDAAQAQLAGVTPLTDAEREALAAELAQHTTAHAAFQAEVERLEAAERWHVDLAAKRAHEQEGETRLLEAAQAVEAAAPREAELQLVVAAQALRPAVGDADRLAIEHAQGEAALGALAAEVGRTAEVLAVAGAAKDAAVATKAAATKAQADAQPALAEARALDAQLVTKRNLATEADGAAEARRAEAIAAEAEAKRAEAALADCRATLTRARAWREANRKHEALAKNWGRWSQVLDDLAKLQGEIDANAKQLKDADKGLKKADDALGKVQAAHTEATQAVAKAQAALAEAEAREAALDLPAARQRREAAEARRAPLTALKALAEEAARATDEHAAQVAETTAARAQAVEATSLHAAADKAGTLAEGKLEEAKASLARLDATKSLDQHRAELMPGEACPLCGATEHPYADAAPAVKEEIAALKKRIKAIEKEKTEAARMVGEAKTTASLAETRAAAAEARAAALTERLASLAVEWTAQRTVAALADLPEQPGAPALAVLTTHQAELGATLAAVAATERDAETARAAADAACKDVAAGQKELDKAVKAQQDAALKHQEAKLAGEQARQAAGTLATKRHEAFTLLEPAFAGDDGWQARWSKDPAAFVAACRDQMTAWDRNEDEAKAAEAEEPGRVAEVQVAAAAYKAATEAFTAAETKRQALAAELVTLTATRAGLLTGQPADAVASQLQAAVQAADEGVERAASDLTAAASEAAAADTRHKEAVAALASLAERYAAAQATLTAKLAEAGLTLDVLRARLAHDQAWIDQQRGELDALRNAMAAATATRDERRSQRTAHEATNSPGIDVEALADALAAAREARAQGDATLEAVRYRLQRDEEARTTHAAQLVRVADLRDGARVWEKLRDLIGSSDGKKFRGYAQGLTLTMLLELANTHLEELRPRYRLMKVTGEELEVQVVDRDMGHEVRSAHSLSGGETFLISLALALALSSFASKRQRIRSLFIDEGFGSLDAQTLEDAIATLDALQAQGRQVGLISHVPGLGDRLGVQVKVTPVGGGRSRLSVDAGGPRVMEKWVPLASAPVGTTA